MTDQVEQTPQGVQDPVQPAASAPAVPDAGNAPWSGDLAQFGDQAQAVDAYLRTRWQPRVTQLEQQYAETEAARQLLSAYEADADAANVAVNRQLYGDEYADQLAASMGRTDLLVNPQPQAAPQVQQQQVAPPAEQQPAAPDPRYEEMYKAWADEQQQRQYDEAKAQFLSDPQYADIDSELFDPFVSNADTWGEAANMYRAWAAHYASRNGSTETQETTENTAPVTIGSSAVGGPGSTPSQPRETLDQAIEGIFGENRPVAPNVIGGQ